MKSIQLKQTSGKNINYLWAVFIVSFFLLWPLILTAAQVLEKTTPGDTEKILSIESIDAAIRALDNTLDKMARTQMDKLAHEPGAASPRINQKINELTALNSAYVRLKNALLGLEKVKKEQLTIQKEQEDYRANGMINPPPYSLTFHDSIQVEIFTVARNKKNIELTIETLKKNISDYQNQLAQKEKELRQFKEKLSRNNVGQTVQDTIKLELDEISVKSLTILLQALDIEKNRNQIENSTADLKIQMAKDQESFVGSNISHDKKDLDHQLELIRNKEIVIQDEISKLQKDQKSIEQELINTRQNLNTARLEQKRNITQVFLKAGDEWRKAYIIMLELKQDVLVLLNRQKTIWQYRYAIVENKLSYSQKKEIKDETEKNIDSLNQTLQIQQTYLMNLQKQISAIDGLMQEEDVSPSIKKYMLIEMDALRKQFDGRLELQSMIVGTDQLERNLLAQIEKQMDQTPVKDHFSGFSQTLKNMWNTEIWVVDQHSVSVGKVFVALIILVIGIIFVRFLLHIVHRRILAASQFKETTASAVHKALSYFAYLLVFLFALRIVNIPLTAFAFLGGAIAIGVGFGAQNLINNFISGFIILGERPINIGDLIEVDGLLGKVEEIGARCTRVRTGENVHKLVPNSSFLEKNITNWTLSDNKIRTKVVIGVAYGSSVKQVQNALIEAAKSNPDILKSPEPFVLFSDFGDNALVFEIYFWVMIRMVLEKKQIESRLRFEIDSQFRKEGIVISFPQRDIHFDTDKPLSIKWVETSISDKSFKQP